MAVHMKRERSKIYAARSSAASWKTDGLSAIRLPGIKTVQLHLRMMFSLSWCSDKVINLHYTSDWLNQGPLTRDSCAADASEGGGHDLNTRPIFTSSVTVLSADDFGAVYP